MGGLYALIFTQPVTAITLLGVMNVDAHILKNFTHEQLVEHVQSLARGKANAEQAKAYAEQGQSKAERELEALKEQIRLMVTQRYGRRSERQTDDLMSDLFNEA